MIFELPRQGWHWRCKVTIKRFNAKPAPSSIKLPKLRQRRLQTTSNLAQWAPQLLVLRQFENLELLTEIAIKARAFDISAIAAFQKTRVACLVAQKKYEAALVTSKGYYNLASLRDTGAAVDMVCEELRLARGNGPSRLFREQQETQANAGASEQRTPRSTAPSTEISNEISVFFSIGGDEQTFLSSVEALRARRGSNGQYSCTSLMAQGNLLLLSGLPDDALTCFSAACGSADNRSAKTMREAVEGIARAIRAQDGSIARANAFLLAARADAVLEQVSPQANRQRIKEAASQTQLGQLRITAEPPSELARARSQEIRGLPSLSVDSAFECGTPVIPYVVSPTHIKIVVNSPTSSWFCFRLKGAGGRSVRIDIDLDRAAADKWASLNPVFTSAADLNTMQLQEMRNEFVSDSSVAWNGAILPAPPADGWKFIHDVWRSSVTTISMVERYDSDSVIIAMRVPCPPLPITRYLSDLKPRDGLSLSVIEVGKSRGHRPLQVVRIGSPRDLSGRQKPCIVIYSGEHADEFDAIWTSIGAIKFLNGPSSEAQALTDRVMFLIIPALDPDASARGIHSSVITTFSTQSKTPEAVAYANWMTGWVDSGNRLDLIFDLHNVQSRESTNLACALMEGIGARGQLSEFLNSAVFDAVPAGWTTTKGIWARGWSPYRLGGWLSRRFGPLCLSYEINAQAPDRHATVAELQTLGGLIARSAGDFILKPDARALLDEVDARRADRRDRWLVSGKQLADFPDAVEAEAVVSKGVGINESQGGKVEAWIP
jgi:hypothetical protein